MSGGKTERIEKLLREVRHYLPEQGPIQVFIHHNTLHAFEHLGFEEAVEHVALAKSAEPYLTHEAFLAEKARGGISEDALWRTIDRSLANRNPFNRQFTAINCDRRALWYHLLHLPEVRVPDETIRWLVAETSVFSRLWEVVLENLGSEVAEEFSAELPVSERVNERVTAFCAAYFDQGFGYWPMPGREFGLLGAFRFLYAGKLAGTPFESAEALDILAGWLANYPEEKWEHELRREAMELPGWAGTVATLEARPHLLPEKHPDASLAEFLAVRLCLRHLLGEEVRETRKKSLGSLGPLYTVFRLLERLKVTASAAARFTGVEWRALLEEVRSFGDIARRRLLQQAYEETFNGKFLGGIVANAALNKKSPAAKPNYQAVFCIDDREESLRRHIEEVSDEVETLAVAGFFGVDMWYQGLGDRHSVALCPVVITPKHFVRETAVKPHADREKAKLRRLKLVQAIATGIYDHSRNLILGWWLAAVAGFAASVPLFLRVLFPRTTTRLNHYLASLWFPSVETDLILERDDSTGGGPTGLLAGFNLEEMALRVAGVLKAIGLVKDFTPLVFVFGHGSSSLNNPHESAYDCGACGGGRGGPNARAFARMANLPSVRKRLAERGLNIPDGTYFVGGFHDTCSDAIVYFDTTKIPSTHVEPFRSAKRIFEAARARDAHERCRRFENARQLPPERALAHVEGRSQDLREPRPEYGHSTNALCVVGRRELSRNLFLDRRCFLSTYEPATDPSGEILAGILGAVIPVCAGISLEYYFSCVDNEVYGCGTKLPHNVTSLIGVMNGRMSDLRTGLTLQMVEIHGPVRILFIIEAEQAKMEAIMAANATIGTLVRNRWVQLALIDPASGAPKIYREGAFVPFLEGEATLEKFPSSLSYYARRSEHLWPVRIPNAGEKR